jgi:CelD/BcsL family acetyltransferase involved in cellulose biosynthesis
VPAHEWALLTARPPASITASRAWVEAALSTVDRRCTPCLASFYDRNGRLVGLLTLMCEERHAGGKLVRFAASPFNDLADAITLPGYAEPVSVAAAAFLRERAAHGWSVHLSEVDPDGALASDRHSAGRLHWEPGSVAPVVDLERRSRAPSLPRHRGLLRAFERLRGEHRVAFAFTSGVAMVAEVEAFIDLRERRLRALSRTLDDPPLNFLRATLHALAESGRCAFMQLLVDDEVVARDLYLLDQNVAMLWLRALDMNWLRPPCGHLLLEESIRWLCSEGFTTLDFGRGGERYKLEWGARPRQLLSATA